MNDQKRAGAALIFIVFGNTLNTGNGKLSVITGTLLVLAGFVVLVPVLKRKYRESKMHWRSFIVLSALGVLLVLANAAYQLMAD